MAGYFVFNLFGQLGAASVIQLMQQASRPTPVQIAQLSIAVGLGVAGGVAVQERGALPCSQGAAADEALHSNDSALPGRSKPIMGSPTWTSSFTNLSSLQSSPPKASPVASPKPAQAMCISTWKPAQDGATLL